MSDASKIDDGGFSPAFVDEQLENVMRAAGSSLRHYMPSSKALHPKAAANWKRARTALQAYEAAQ